VTPTLCFAQSLLTAKTEQSALPDRDSILPTYEDSSDPLTSVPDRTDVKVPYDSENHDEYANEQLYSVSSVGAGPSNSQHPERHSTLPPGYAPQRLPSEFANVISAGLNMNVVLQVVGSWADVQSFVSLSKLLSKKYGHRVRLASQPLYRQFVEQNEIEFCSLGESSNELFKYIEQQNNLADSNRAQQTSGYHRIHAALLETLQACWTACFEMKEDSNPFIADAIIANLQSFAHIHCAEKLGVPSHLIYS
jgi:hypothetical protein